jgi:hypothetical protein
MELYELGNIAKAHAEIRKGLPSALRNPEMRLVDGVIRTGVGGPEGFKDFSPKEMYMHKKLGAYAAGRNAASKFAGGTGKIWESNGARVNTPERVGRLVTDYGTNLPVENPLKKIFPKLTSRIKQASGNASVKLGQNYKKGAQANLERIKNGG